MTIATVNFSMMNVDVKVEPDGLQMLIVGEIIADNATYNAIMDNLIIGGDFGIVVASKCDPTVENHIAMVGCKVAYVYCNVEDTEYKLNVGLGIDPLKYKYIMNDITFEFVDTVWGNKPIRQLAFKVDDSVGRYAGFGVVDV